MATRSMSPGAEPPQTAGDCAWRSRGGDLLELPGLPQPSGEQLTCLKL